jgi:hypothetical protein
MTWLFYCFFYCRFQQRRKAIIQGLLGAECLIEVEKKNDEFSIRDLVEIRPQPEHL